MMRDTLEGDCPVLVKDIGRQGIRLTELMENSDGAFISVELCPRNFNTEILGKLAPKFCSVPWLGYSGSNCDEIPSLILTKRLHNAGYEVLLHLAGRSLNKIIVLEILEKMQELGVRNILAVQGDQSRITEQDDAKYDFPFASDLVKFIKDQFNSYFCVAVAAYPDLHPKSASIDDEFRYLQQKVTSGADLIITQHTFNFKSFKEFCDNYRKFSIVQVPVLAGLFVMNSNKVLLSVSKLCGLSAGDEILNYFNKFQHNDKALEDYGISNAVEFIRNIESCKSYYSFVKGVHIFTLNNLELVQKVLNQLKSLNLPENTT